MTALYKLISDIFLEIRNCNMYFDNFGPHFGPKHPTGIAHPDLLHYSDPA